MQKQLKLELAKQGEVTQANNMEDEEELEEDVFEAVSKRAWTDVLLQLLKVKDLCCVLPMLHFKYAFGGKLCSPVWFIAFKCFTLFHWNVKFAQNTFLHYHKS